MHVRTVEKLRSYSSVLSFVYVSTCPLERINVIVSFPHFFETAMTVAVRARADATALAFRLVPPFYWQ